MNEEFNHEPIAEENEAVEETVEGLKKALQEEKEKSAGNLANWQRAQADFINYKRRVEQEREEQKVLSKAGLMLSFLPILDDLERALASVPPELAGNGWVEGVKLIDQKALNGLKAQGLSPIEAVGEPFDPYFHEAVRQAAGKDGIVIEEVQKGYMFFDKVIRPSRVVVGNGEGESKEAEQDE